MRPSVLVYLLCVAFIQAYSPRGTDQGYQEVVVTYPPISEPGDSKDPDPDFSFEGDPDFGFDEDYDNNEVWVAEALTSDNNIAADTYDGVYEDIMAGGDDEDAYVSLYEDSIAGGNDVNDDDYVSLYEDSIAGGSDVNDDAYDGLYEDIVTRVDGDVNGNAYDRLYDDIVAGDVINEDTLPVHADVNPPTAESVNVEEEPLYTDDVSGYQKYADSDCIGNDFVGCNTVTYPSECGALCDQTEGCIAFVFDARNTINNCFLKNICGNLKDLPQVHTYKQIVKTEESDARWPLPILNLLSGYRDMISSRYPAVMVWPIQDVSLLYGLQRFLEDTLKDCLSVDELISYRTKFAMTAMEYLPWTSLELLNRWFDETLLKEDWLGAFLNDTDICRVMGQTQNQRSMRHHHGDRKWSTRPHAHDRHGPPPPRHGTYHDGDGVKERDRFTSVRDKKPHNRYNTNNYYRGGTGGYHGDIRQGKRPRRKRPWGKRPRRHYDGKMRGDDDLLAMSDMEMEGREGDYYSGGVLMKALECFFKRKLKYGPVNLEDITQYREEFVVSTIHKLAPTDQLDRPDMDLSTDLMDWFDKVVSEDWFPDFLKKICQKYAVADRMFDKVEALEQIMEIAERAGIDRRHHRDGEMNVCLCL